MQTPLRLFTQPSCNVYVSEKACVHLPVHGSSEELASVATSWQQQQRAEVNQQQLDALVNTYRPIRCASQLSGAHASPVLVPRLWGLYITIARLFDPLPLNLRNRSTE